MERTRVLVVDDDLTICQMLQDVLEAEGYTVECAQTSAAGLAHVETGGVSLVVVDVSLPGESGLALCQQIRQRPDSRRLPIIAISGWHDSETATAARRAGADDYLTKPLDLNDLLTLVASRLPVAPEDGR